MQPISAGGDGQLPPTSTTGPSPLQPPPNQHYYIAGTTSGVPAFFQGAPHVVPPQPHLQHHHQHHHQQQHQQQHQQYPSQPQQAYFAVPGAAGAPFGAFNAAPPTGAFVPHVAPSFVTNVAAPAPFAHQQQAPQVRTHGQLPEPLLLMHPSPNSTPGPGSQSQWSAATRPLANPSRTPTHRGANGTASPVNAAVSPRSDARQQRDAAAAVEAVQWGAQRLSSALAAMSSDTDALPVRALQDFREMCESKKATDGEMYAALRTEMSEAAFDAFVTLYQRSPLPRCLLDDLTEARGILWLAVFDACCCPTADATTTATERAAIGLELLKPILELAAVLAASQRGCIALMRVVSAVHHDGRLLTAVVRDMLAKHAAVLLTDERASYVLCHSIAGLHAPSPNAAVDASSFAKRFATHADRANYLLDITSWAAGEDAAQPLFHTRDARNTCDPESWAAFVDRVCAALIEHADVVLRGRQQCFVLWHVVRRWPVLQLPRGAELLNTYCSPIPCVPWPPPPPMAASASGGGTSVSGSQQMHGLTRAPGSPRSFSASGERLGLSLSASHESQGLLSASSAASISVGVHTPMNTLCRSTPGRCALAALLERATEALQQPTGDDAVDEEVASRVRAVVDAARLLSAGGLPSVDRRLEATMKRRPGMEAARTVDSRVDELLAVASSDPPLFAATELIPVAASPAAASPVN